VTNANTITSQDDIVGRRTVVLNGETISYARFLRPEAILSPRIFRVGAKLAF
jgi:hypothetical protein